MSKRQSVWLTGLLLLLAAAGVWLRDLQWTDSVADTIPLALGIPATFLLGMPWKIGGGLSKNEKILGGLASAVFAIGWMASSITTLSIGWTGLAYVWMGYHFTREAGRRRLACILLLSFPWLVLEWPQIGWWCRNSAAIIGEQIFRLLALPVERVGTSMVILGVPVEIEAACAGWNLLQLTLLTGVAFGAYEIRSSRRFLWLLLILPFVAWFANVVRIILLSAIALSFGTELASGALHGMMGLVILVLVILITKGICYLLDGRTARQVRVIHT